MSTENSNLIQIILTDKNDKKATVQAEFIDAQFSLNDALILQFKKKLGLDDIKSCYLKAGVNNIAISIENYTLTPTVFIEGFYNIHSSISILQVKNVDVHINNQNIELMQVDSEKIILCDCTIKQLDVGLTKVFASLKEGKNNFARQDCKSIDVRNCTIGTIQNYANCKHFNVQNSTIKLLNLFSGISGNEGTIDHLLIWKYSSIDTMDIQFKITEFKIEESNINTIIAKSGCYINELLTTNSLIVNAYNFDTENFNKLDVLTWKLIATSASNQGLTSKKANALYNLTKQSYKSEKGLKALFGSFINFVSGYGYKPHRALIASLVVVLFSALIIYICDLIAFQLFNITTTNSFLTDLRIAITSLIGQGGLTYANGFSYWVSFFEYICGVLLFAIFVNALYVRYKD